MTNEGERRKINIPVRTVVRIEFKDNAGTQWATADVTDRSEHAIGISLRKSMEPGSVIVLRGKLGADKTEVQLRATVSWCREQSDGTFQAGLEFLDANPDFSTGGGQPVPTDPDELDCYEVMQLSPNADAETIERVYRMLAQRYHPDNVDTGNSELFIQLCEAYRVLGSPVSVLAMTPVTDRPRDCIGRSLIKQRRLPGARRRNENAKEFWAFSMPITLRTLRGPA